LADTCHSALLKDKLPNSEKREYSVKTIAESITCEKQLCLLLVL
jgi:hypothetical protein